MNSLGRLLVEKEVKAKLKQLTDYIERVSDEDLFDILRIVNDFIEKGKPIKTEKINEKGEWELL